jgi:hypothetical protein
MVVVPLDRPQQESDSESTQEQSLAPVPWTRIAAAGTLIVGGGLLLSGRRKAGLVAAATGASLAMLDQQRTLKAWWQILPGYIGEVQRVLTQVQDAVDDVSVKRDKLEQTLSRIRTQIG